MKLRDCVSSIMFFASVSMSPIALGNGGRSVPPALRDAIAESVADQETKLSASDSVPIHEFARSVSISGDTAVVSGHGDHAGGNRAGAAYVFVRSGTTWSEQAKLTASDPAADDVFGWSVSISGDTIVVGAPSDGFGGLSSPGSAYVFARSGVTWSEQAKLTASDADNHDDFGFSVGISGDTIVVGSYQDDDGALESGSVYVFVRSGVTWSEQAKLNASDTQVLGLFGSAVALDGDTAIVGANNVASTAAVYVFTRSGVTWSEQAKLFTSDSVPIYYSVALNGDTLIAGAPGDGAGSAYVFARSGSTWTEQQKLVPADGSAGDRFGEAVAVDSSTAVIGSKWDDGPFDNTGSSYIFVRTGTVWFQQARIEASDAANGDGFGQSVAVESDTAIIGSFSDDGAGWMSGSAYVFRFKEPWASLGFALAGTYGDPLLAGGGTLAMGEEIAICLSSARENALAALVIGTSPWYLPFRGGVLVPDLSVLLAVLATDGNGEIALPSTVSSVLPPGTTVYFQFWIQDPAGPVGYSASNAVSQTAP